MLMRRYEDTKIPLREVFQNFDEDAKIRRYDISWMKVCHKIWRCVGRSTTRLLVYCLYIYAHNEI